MSDCRPAAESALELLLLADIQASADRLSDIVDDRIGLPYADPEDILADVGHALEAVFDSGAVGIEMSTILDLTGPEPRLVRQGLGDVSRVVDLG